MQQLDLRAAKQWRTGRSAHAPGGFKRVAYGVDTGTSGCAKDRAQRAREHVGMFMGVDVSQLQSATLQLLDLRGGLGLDFLLECAIRKWPQRSSFLVQLMQEAPQCRAECAYGSDGVYKPNKIVTRSQNGLSIDEYDVAADAQGRVGNGELNGFIGGGCARHKGGAGQHSVAMQFDDCLIDAVGEAEVVGVDDDAFHQLSLPS